MKNGLQEGIVKFEVSGTSQAVLFEGVIAAELCACSGVNDKFRYCLVSLDFLVLWHQGKRTGTRIEVIGFIRISYFSLLVQRKVTKEKTLFLRYFCPKGQNRKKFPKFSPRLRKFLTGTSCYTEEKEG
ncbi:hypothetical protein [Leeuwenhoekiella marinoflava]|uniref:hypothetical protein n=1 Tax=Leeuwenhoekiella marinoflava TaxID=988 RepID=UPI00093474CF|nr:hypothetical protein [Leeuwenhoekiella marinoflava]